MKVLLSFSFILFLSNLVLAQNQTASTSTTPNTTTSEIDWANFENELAKSTNENWSFHTDQEGKLLYIDFESLGGKMNRLVLKSAEESIVMEDNHLFDLPINTIYEVNLEKLKRGSYFVELYTYNEQVIHKTITIN